MLSNEVIAVYDENDREPKIQNVALLIVKAGGTYSHHKDSKG
jgi:hypothetical protein